MTAEPDLLPCPGCNGASVRVIGGPGTKGGPQYWAGCDYCRWRTWGNTEAEAIAAWNRRATAARDAEVEALRAEVETLRDGLDYLRQMQGVPDVLELRAKAARAERLAEALRNSSDALERLAFAIRAPNAHTPQLVELAIAMRAAALEAFRDGTTSPVTSPVRILIDAIESEIRQLEGTEAWKSQAARIASLRAAIDAVRENDDNTQSGETP